MKILLKLDFEHQLLVDEKHLSDFIKILKDSTVVKKHGNYKSEYLPEESYEFDIKIVPDSQFPFLTEKTDGFRDLDFEKVEG